MRKILIIASSIILSSCSTLILNQGFKSYKSDIIQTKEYKRANPYQQDLLYLNDLCANSFPDIENIFPRQQREHIVDSLTIVLSDKKVGNELFWCSTKFYLSHFENQHTSIQTNNTQVDLFPYILRPDNGNWYLWNINNDYDSLLIGKQIVKMNKVPINDIERKLFKYVSAENQISKRNEISKFTNRPSLLKQLGLIEQSDSILISFKTGENIWVKAVYADKDIHFHFWENRFKPNPITKYVNHNYDIALYPNDNFAYFQFNKCNDKIDSYETMSEYLRPWIVPFAKMYLNKQIKKKNSQKTRGFVDVDRPVFKDYLELMFDSIQKQGIANLIIDLRNNPGGSSLLCTQLMYYLTEKEDLKDFSKMYCLSDFNKQIDKKEYKSFVKSYVKEYNKPPEKDKLYLDGFFNCDSLLFEKIENNKSAYYIPKNRKIFKGKVIVLANYQTGSAAALLTTLLQDNNIATVVGTCIGNNPIGATGYKPYKLLNSKATGSVATNYLIRPLPQKGKSFIPDYWIENGVNETINGNDKYLEKALEILKK